VVFAMHPVLGAVHDVPHAVPLEQVKSFGQAPTVPAVHVPAGHVAAGVSVEPEQVAPAHAAQIPPPAPHSFAA